jgi:hypothetical protein
MRNTVIPLVAVAVAAAAVAAIAFLPEGARPAPAPAAAHVVPTPGTTKPRVLFVDSYHEGYPWSEEITLGVLEAFKITRASDGSLDEADSPVALRICRMDTKRNASEEAKVQAGQSVRGIVESWKPDVVICADDNASQYLIVPFYRDSTVPFVFCGVNWDASAYGFPRANVTGILEVCQIPSLLAEMQRHARGPRVALLGARNESNAKEAENYRSQFGVAFDKVVFVDTFAEWKRAYLELQDAADMLILAPPSFLAAGPATAGDQAEARQFVLENTRIPSGSVEDWIAPYSLICYAKLGSEQGEWAARTARRILGGVSPSDIPVARNKDARIYLNMPLARRLDARFSVDLLEQAVLVLEETPCGP